jgi:hypothetical protein
MLKSIFNSKTIDKLISVTNCARTVSQQEESGQWSAPITHGIANLPIEVQRATTTTQPPIIIPYQKSGHSIAHISMINFSLTEIFGSEDKMPINATVEANKTSIRLMPSTRTPKHIKSINATNTNNPFIY